MRPSKKLLRIAFFAGLFASGFSSALSAADVYWTGGGADNSWATGGNWSNGVPASNTVRFDTQTTNWFTQNLNATYTVAGVVVGNPGGDITVTNNSFNLSVGAAGIDMSRATRNLSVRANVNASQTWTVTNGIRLTTGYNMIATSSRTLTLAGDGEFYSSQYWQVGQANNSGAVVHSGGALSFDSGLNCSLFIGHSSTAGQPGVGTYTLDGGTIRLSSSKDIIRLGNQSYSGDGRFNLYSGVIAATNANLHVGYAAGASGAYLQTNGAATFSLVSVPYGAGATGTVVQSGGTLTTTTLNVGAAGAGAMVLTNAGQLNLAGVATVGSSTAATVGALRLDGGTVNFTTTGANLAKGASGTITANGVKFSNQTGTSAGGASGTVIVSSDMALGAGGLTVGPSAGGSRWFTLSGNLSGSGGVTFDSQGLNTFSLSGTSNTFSGGIVVASGYFGNGNAGSVPMGSALSLGGNWAIGADATLGSLSGSAQIFSGPGTVRTITAGCGDASSVFSGSGGVNAGISIALDKVGAHE